MKKIITICAILLAFFSSKAQVLTAPSTAESGTEFLISGSLESNSGYITGAQVLNYSSSPFQNISVTLDAFQGYLSPSNPTKYKAKITVIGTPPITTSVTLNLKYFVGNYTGVTGYFKEQSLTISVNLSAPVQTTFYNVAKSGVFTKNNCSAGTTGSQITYTVPAHTYSASTQAAADQKADNDVNINGQNYANSHGQCLTLYYNTLQSGTFYKNDCPSLNAGGPGPGVIYTIAANNPACTSTISQQDADAKALNLVNAQGQAYANANGQCSSAFTLDIVSQDSPADDSYQLGASPIITFKFINTEPSSGLRYELRVQSPSGDVTYGPQTLNRFRFKMNVAGQYIVSGRTVDASGTQSQWIDRFLIASN